jgi:hypothetical protein
MFDYSAFKSLSGKFPHSANSFVDIHASVYSQRTFEAPALRLLLAELLLVLLIAQQHSLRFAAPQYGHGTSGALDLLQKHAKLFASLAGTDALPGHIPIVQE